MSMMYTGGENTSSYRATLFLFQDGKAMLIDVTDGHIAQGLGSYKDDRLNKLTAAMDKSGGTGFLAGSLREVDSFVWFADQWPPPELVSEATQSGALRVVPVSDLLYWVREAKVPAE